MTASEQVAATACSMFGDDGTSFIGVEPEVENTVDAGLTFRMQRMLAEGSLFVPQVMEEKWALYYYGGKIIVVRTWLRKVFATAEVVERGGLLEVTSLRGILAPGEDPAMSVRVLDYLLRTHVLREAWPVPLLPEFASDLETVTMFSFSQFGRMAEFASPHPVRRTLPETPLRTMSRLHWAVRRDDVSEVRAQLAAGIPVDLPGFHGSAPIHYATGDPAMLRLLLEAGSPVDARADEDETPLMYAVLDSDMRLTGLLLANGANPNAVDRSGFNALYRVAQTGHRGIAELLLSYGADPTITAGGQSPAAEAEENGFPQIAALLRKR